MASKTNLPYPWELRWSKTKSRYYYYNTETKTSQWKSPAKGQSVVKNAAEIVKVPNCTLTKKSEIVQLQEDKSTKKSEKMSPVKTKGDVKILNSKKRKCDENSVKPVKKCEPSSEEKKESFLPRILRVSEPAKSGKNSEKACMLFARDGKTTQNGNTKSSLTLKLKDENSKSKSKLKLEFSKKSSKIQACSAVVSKLESDSEPKPDKVKRPNIQSFNNPFAQEKMEEKEEEEDMEVEYSQEVQMIFQEIQDVRDEMKKFVTQEVTTDVQMIVDNMSTACTSTPQVHSQLSVKKLWLVLDTNLFLEDGHLLLNLKDQMSRQFHDVFVFVIPWVVIQEIDHIKGSNRSQTKALGLQSRARAAVNMINDWLETKDPCVVGQNPRDAASTCQTKDGFMVENNDDKILHCCLQYQDKYSSSQVALLTLDKNLRNKAMVMGINTFSKEMLNKWLKNSSLNKNSVAVNKTAQPNSNTGNTSSPLCSNNSWFSPCSNSALKTFNPSTDTVRNHVLSATSASEFASSPTNEQNSSTFFSTPHRVFAPRSLSFTPGLNESLPETGSLSFASFDSVPSSAASAFMMNATPASMPNFLNHQMSSIKAVMLDGLSAVVELSMKDAYQDLWEDILHVKKPWTVIDILKAINKHWVAVFKSFWKRDDQHIIQELGSAFRTCADTFSELSTILENCRLLWSSFDPNGWEVSSSCQKFASIKKQSLVQLSNLEESLRHDSESETGASLLLDRPSAETVTSRSSVELDSSIVSPAATVSVVAAAATPCVLPPPLPAAAEPMVLEDELHRVYDCFDVVLKHIISLRDLIREQLSTSIDQPNRATVLQSFMQLGQYVCTIHDQYQRALRENENINSANVYFELLSTLSSFTQQFSIQVFPITWQALQQFFRDATKRAVVEIGLSQIESIRATVFECSQFLTSSESRHFFCT